MKKKKAFFVIVSLVLFITLIIGFVYVFSYKNSENRIKFEFPERNYTAQSLDSLTPTQIPTPTISPTPTPPPPIKLLFLGDIMTARSIGDKIISGSDPFQFVSPIFMEYDFVIGNLETTVGTKGRKAPGKLYTFQAPVESLEYIKKSGINVVSLANNHTMDYGTEGLIDTIDNLNVYKIKHFGAGNNIDEAFQPLIIEKHGTKIALVGLNEVETYYTQATASSPGNANFNRDYILKSFEKSNTADIIIPYVHWGTEFSPSYNSTQQNNAQFMIDNGASIVIGGHPHVVQPSATYKDKEIIYSIGNFVFDLMYGTAAEGNMVEVVIDNKKIVSTKLIPYKLNSDGFPVPQE